MSKLVLVLVFILLAGFCLADEISVPPTDDMFTDCLTTGTHIESELYLNKENSAGEERVMFKFDVSAVVTLESAVLNLHRFFACGEGGGQTAANIYLITEEWDEETWDCHTYPQYDDDSAIPYTFTGPVGMQDTWFEIDITYLVEQWVYGLVPNNGLVIIADYGQRHSKFNSKETASTDWAPYLTLNGTLPAQETEIIPIITAANYPNPFNPETIISFNIPTDSGTLTIYNPRGQKIMQQNYPAGEHSFTWEADKYSSGIYFYQIKTGTQILNRKMSLIK
ncbi:MAG: DNRLRE domain-containing protein [Candidatus Stygibacter australis]|nr:DNRLRE domain-containing protein [Candidatus Stygibacter australis]MDP8321489.1 DNRLRE domain-containing protein [Candidatus Stygibacter australis]